MHNVSDDDQKIKSTTYIPPAGMDGGLQLSSLCSSSRCNPAVASFHHTQILAPRPSPLAKLTKTPIRVNPLAFSLCGAYRSSTADELGNMNRRKYSEHIKEWVTRFKRRPIGLFSIFY
jgi:hypothetical protein